MVPGPGSQAKSYHSFGSCWKKTRRLLQGTTRTALANLAEFGNLVTPAFRSADDSRRETRDEAVLSLLLMLNSHDASSDDRAASEISNTVPIHR